MQRKMELDINSKYNLPKTKIIEYGENILVISSETSNWLVLKNRNQRSIYELLMNEVAISDVMKQHEENMQDVIYVLTQIEAKKFYDRECVSIFSNDVMHLYLTNGCNLNCPHCYMYSGKRYKEELTTDEIKKLCSDFYECGGKRITLSGGEALTRSDFVELAQYISTIGLEIGVMSNGTLWTSKIIEKLSECNINRVQISLDGYDEESNAIIRGKGSFDKALSTIKILLANGIRVNIGITPPYEFLKKHKNEYLSFASELVSEHKDLLSIQFSYELIEGRCISNEEIKQFKKEYYEIIDTIMTSIYPDNDENGFVDNLKNGKVFDNCGYGGINIAANGDVFFCSRITEIKSYGNIRDTSFKDIYSMSQDIQKIANIDNLKPCCNCDIKYICGGGCRVDHFNDLVFSDLTQNIQYNRDKCSREYKEKYYKLMIKANERFYK
ncbi:radical SAM/SPASM domain-containing protein [Clostridium tyrobutyricum]|uniref:radical SAM/SPASM domain-containing protein n=1 Tax=Clostridium tyrobutyricum TaxID=1519 RepID=UPI002B1F1F51|nr:radical SAM protein [Clostridium tyrobutyricum]MEA5009346.1 radical SAM protein [Clostridium tyrobutyricum]